jgi:hypothetical protein
MIVLGALIFYLWTIGRQQGLQFGGDFFGIFRVSLANYKAKPTNHEFS